MAVKLEAVTRTFYENLEKGKIMGKKCKDCGAMEFPPRLACNTCGSTNMEWAEISGKATMHAIVLPAQLSSKPEYAPLKPFAYGEIHLEEGSQFNGVVRGINKKKRRVLVDKLPINVTAAIYQRDGYKTVVFDLDEGQCD